MYFAFSLPENGDVFNRNLVSNLNFSPSKCISLFPCLRMETFSIPSLIKIWSALRLPAFDLCQQNPAIKAASWSWYGMVWLKQHLLSALKQHLDLLSTKGSSTTQTKPAHNLRMLWKWISWSTSSDFSGIWFSFQKNPLDWPLNQEIRKMCTLEIKWVKSPIKPPGHHSSVVTSGWQMRPDWFQASLFLALIKTDKPSKTLTEFLSTFKYVDRAQISEAEKLAEIYIF